MTVHKLTGVSYVSNLNAHFIDINFQWKNKHFFCATFLKLCLHGCGCDCDITFLVNTYRHVHTSREKYPSPPSNRSISVCVLGKCPEAFWGLWSLLAKIIHSTSPSASVISSLFSVSYLLSPFICLYHSHVYHESHP